MKQDQIIVTGKISISRPSHFDEREEVVITILDDVAGAVLGEVRLGLAEFTKAVTGEGRIDCVVEVSRDELSRIGTVCETKREFVPGRDRNKAAEALAPFMVDGWTPRERDYGNHHNWRTQRGVEGCNVCFVRNVPKDGDEVNNG